jgi:hypothetical protein
VSTIWKYPLEISDVQSVSLPLGAEVLTVQTQGGNACIWALVDPKETRKEIRKVRIFGTGHNIEGDAGQYVGTFQIANGRLVFHVFVGRRQSR